MATYNNLPVYKASYDLLLELFQVCNNFSRDYRFTIGEQIKKEVIELILLIYRANKSFESRKSQIESAREKTETIRVLARILHDLKQINLKKFVSLNEKIGSISKQLVLWSGDCQKRNI